MTSTNEGMSQGPPPLYLHHVISDLSNHASLVSTFVSFWLGRCGFLPGNIGNWARAFPIWRWGHPDLMVKGGLRLQRKNNWWVQKCICSWVFSLETEFQALYSSWFVKWTIFNLSNENFFLSLFATLTCVGLGIGLLNTSLQKAQNDTAYVRWFLPWSDHGVMRRRYFGPGVRFPEGLIITQTNRFIVIWLTATVVVIMNRFLKKSISDLRLIEQVKYYFPRIYV